MSTETEFRTRPQGGGTAPSPEVVGDARVAGSPAGFSPVHQIPPRASLPSGDDEASPLRAPGEMETQAETPSLKKILLVEDDPQDAELTLAALEANHLANQVALVRDGVEALDYLHSRGKFMNRPPGNPILVLLDNKMPKVSGLQVLKAIKQDEQLRSIPVVALTSSRETPDLVEFYKHGVNAYVVKPVEFSEFVQAIKQLGLFWAAINEPPPVPVRIEAVPQNGAALLPEKNGK